MARLIGVERVYGDGYHNAFTDLLKWREHYYLAFRTAETHGIAPPGDVLVMRSGDLVSWEQCGRLSTPGDDRDPKLVDMGERLAVIFGTWYPRWPDGNWAHGPHDLISHVCYSRDGTSWSTARQMWGPNYWLWRVFKDGDGYLCAAYHFPARQLPRSSRSVHLLRSTDLLDWEFVTIMRAGYDCGEPVLYRPEDKTLQCVLRAVEPDHHSWLGRSVAPYTEWEWSDLGVMIHAPVVIEVKGRWIVAGRSQEGDLPPGTVEATGGHHLSVWEIVGEKAQHLLTVPSGGDCSYAGLAHGPEGEVLMSYYSQHERMPLPKGQPTAADVFLGRLAVS